MQNNIRHWLRKKGGTQTWLSKHVGISCSYLSLIISDKRDPDLELAVKIAEALNVELKEVFPQQRTEVMTGPVNKILLIDDDKNVCEILDVLLRKDGYNVKTVHNGFEAGFQVPVFKPDLLILDILLQGLDGITVCRTLRQDYPNLNILGISSSMNAVLKDRMLEAGANLFLHKPFEYSELKQTIEKFSGHCAVAD
jgi:CheY-like chemotaxis protein